MWLTEEGVVKMQEVLAHLKKGHWVSMSVFSLMLSAINQNTLGFV